MDAFTIQIYHTKRTVDTMRGMETVLFGSLPRFVKIFFTTNREEPLGLPLHRHYRRSICPALRPNISVT